MHFDSPIGISFFIVTIGSDSYFQVRSVQTNTARKTKPEIISFYCCFNPPCMISILLIPLTNIKTTVESLSLFIFLSPCFHSQGVSCKFPIGQRMDENHRSRQKVLVHLSLNSIITDTITDVPKSSRRKIIHAPPGQSRESTTLPQEHHTEQISKYASVNSHLVNFIHVCNVKDHPSPLRRFASAVAPIFTILEIDIHIMLHGRISRWCHCRKRRVMTPKRNDESQPLIKGAACGHVVDS
jgi:hypothetical protein